jgi:hypothetical protein
VSSANSPLSSTVSLSYRVAVAKASVLAKTLSVPEACAIVVESGLSGRGVNLCSCRDALSALRSFADEAQGAVQKWIGLVEGRFPLLSDFSE